MFPSFSLLPTALWLTVCLVEVGDCVHYSQIPCVISLQPTTSASLCWDLPLRVIQCIVKPSSPGLCRQQSSWWNVLLSDVANAEANQTLIIPFLSYFVFMVDESECIVTVLYREKGGCERPRSWRGMLPQIPQKTEQPLHSLCPHHVAVC